MNASNVLVLPVPGGPCHTDSVRPNAFFTAALCDGLSAFPVDDASKRDFTLGEALPNQGGD